MLLLKAIPAATLTVLTLLSLLPWGIAEGERFVLPLLPFACVYFWTRDHGWLLPPALIFVAALAIDVLTFGPLGYWPTVYLLGLAAATAAERLLGRLEGLADWAAFAVVGGIVCALAWGLASAYFASRADAGPMLLAWGGLVLVWPLVVALLSPLERLVTGPRALNLDRRGG